MRNAVRKFVTAAVAGALASIALAACSSGSATATTTGSGAATTVTSSDAPVRGVTSTTIQIGVPYVDLASVAKFTHGLNQGNYPAVYRALINAINARGGINGRKLQATFAPVSPLGGAAATAACTQLTEDSKVFVVMGFLQNNDGLCYTQLHQTPVIGGPATTQLLAESEAPWFTTIPLDNVVEPAAITAAARQGVFSGKRVAVLSLSDAPTGLASSVESALAHNGVRVVSTATVIANTSDPQASLQQINGVVSQKFQAAKANMVVPVGQAAQTWGNATASGSYHPQMLAPSFNDVTAYTDAGSVSPKVMAGAVSAYLQPVASGTKAIGWSDPAMQACVKTVQKAGLKIVPPTDLNRNGNDSFVSVVQACQNLTLFTAIAKKAGRNLTVASFRDAGEHLGAVHIPAQGTGVYSKTAPAGTFPLYVYRWSTSLNTFLGAATPSGTTH